MYLYALRCSRASFGVLRVHRCKYSLIIAFDLCALKFCNHARTYQQERHPEKCARIPSPEHGGRSGHQNRRSGISAICAICRRSVKGSAQAMTCTASATSRNQYKSFSIFQPKFYENFVKFVKNAVLVFEPI